MITIEMLCVRLQRVTPDEVERWIERRWVKADGVPGHYVFHPIDEARIRLILELRDEMQVGEEALPLVLSLLDQVYAGRRHMRRVRDAIDVHADAALKTRLLQVLNELPD